MNHFKKNKKAYIKAGIILLITIVLIVVIKVLINVLKDRKKGQANAAAMGGAVGGSLAAGINMNQTLTNGVNSPAVKELQKLLKTYYGVGGISVDGSFGPQTQSVVQSTFGVSSITLNDVYADMLGEQFGDASGPAYADSLANNMMDLLNETPEENWDFSDGIWVPGYGYFYIYNLPPMY